MQVESSGLWGIPPEVLSAKAKSVDAARTAVVVPESAAVEHCTVSFGPPVVVAVIRAKHHVIVVSECIAGVTRVPGY